MKRKSQELTFGRWRARQTLKKEVNDCSWFALLLGSALFFSMAVRSRYTSGAGSVLCIAAASAGLLLFLTGGFCPLVLKRPVRLLTKALNGIGKIVLRVLLAPLYGLLVLFSLLSRLSGKRNYGFFHWEDADPVLPDSAFREYHEERENGRPGAFLGSLNSVFYALAKYKLLFLLPVVLLLLILGLIFFFLSAHSVFSFVYALF